MAAKAANPKLTDSMALVNLFGHWNTPVPGSRLARGKMAISIISVLGLFCCRYCMMLCVLNATSGVMAVAEVMAEITAVAEVMHNIVKHRTQRWLT